MKQTIIATIAGFLLMGCAQVPRESVELASTVGRDLATVHTAHRQLAQVLFARMRGDIDRFIDQVYTPYQIHTVMARQKELAVSPDPEQRKKSLLLAINAAFQEGASPELQANVLKGMEIMVQRIKQDVESKRRELLDPIDAQEAEVLGSIDRAYQQLHYANSIVTGHLSSVAKVHETQAELLEAIGIERDLRRQVGENLADTADRLAGIVNAAETTDTQLGNVEDSVKELMAALKELETRLTGEPHEE